MYIHVYFCFLLNHQEAFSAAVAKAARARELWAEALETSVELWLAHTAGWAGALAGWGAAAGWPGGLAGWAGGLAGCAGGLAGCPGGFAGWAGGFAGALVPFPLSAHAAVGPPARTACACLCPSRAARPCQLSCAKCEDNFFCARYCAQAGFIAAVELVRLPQPQAYLEGCGTWQLYPNYKYSCKATYKESPSDTPLPLRFRF